MSSNKKTKRAGQANPARVARVAELRRSSAATAQQRGNRRQGTRAAVRVARVGEWA